MYLGVLFTSEGTMDQEMDRWIGSASAVMQVLYRSVNLPVHLRSNPHLWSQALGSDRKNETANAIGQNDFPPLIGFLGTSDPELAGGFISHLAWECLGIPQEELERVAGEKGVWGALLSLLPMQPGPG